MNTFIIADTHFGDENIIKFENRPFQTVSEMDETLIRNWNEVVGEEDRVFILGDFICKNEELYAESILERLNGRKILIVGNHDVPLISFYKRRSDIILYEYPIVYENFWILSHEPMYVNENSPYANIYGHVHKNPSYKTVSSRSACISAERQEYCPVIIQDIQRRVLSCQSF